MFQTNSNLYLLSFDYLSNSTPNRVYIFLFFICAWVVPFIIIVFSYTSIVLMVKSQKKYYIKQKFTPKSGCNSSSSSSLHRVMKGIDCPTTSDTTRNFDSNPRRFIYTSFEHQSFKRKKTIEVSNYLIIISNHCTMHHISKSLYRWSIQYISMQHQTLFQDSLV